MIRLFPRLTDLLTWNEFVEPMYTWSRYDARPPLANSEKRAAWLVALQIVLLRCGGSPHLFRMWFNRVGGGPALSAVEQEVLRAQLTENLAPNGNQVQLQGLVVEHMWYALTLERLLSTGQLIHIEEPSWSVTDHGADGIVVYRHGNTLSFRLWESKQHEATSAVGDTVNRACRQLEARAAKYLARTSKIAQTVEDDPPLAQLYGRMSELWVRGDPRAGAGVNVAVSASAAADGCFVGLPNYFAPFTVPAEREGLLARVEDFPAFCRLVREVVWKGL